MKDAAVIAFMAIVIILAAAGAVLPVIACFTGQQ